MSFKVSFIANQNVTDEDINNIGYNLSNTVYTAFTNDTLYGVDSLNEITSHLMNKGVKRNYENECALTLTDSIIHIDSGLAFFDNGATISIDNDGIDLTLEESAETQYIYLFFNESLNVAGARCTAALPETGVYYVILGSVTNGTLTQDRTFAFLNADVKGTNEVVRLVVERAKKYIDGTYYYEFATPVNVSGYKRAYYRPDFENGNFDYSTNLIFGIVDIQNKILEFSVYAKEANGYSFDPSNFTPYTDISNATENSGVQIVDGILYVRTTGSVQNKLVFEFYGGVAE